MKNKNNELEWWSRVEDRFRAHFPFAIIDWKLGEENDGKATDKMKEILSFFHKEIQEHLHEEGKEELENIEPRGSMGRYLTKREIERAKELEQEKANSVDSELPK